MEIRDELTNQLSSEVHRLDLRIDDTQSAIDDLNDTIKELNNNEINDNINALASIIDEHTSRIKDLESDNANTKQEVVQQRMTKSTRSTSATDEDIQELHDEIHEVANDVDQLSASTSSRLGTLEQDSAFYNDAILAAYDNIADVWDAMDDMDREHHDELHMIASDVDRIDASYGQRLNNLELHSAYYQQGISDLYEEDSSIWNAMDAMDVEHHEELHLLADKIDRIDASHGQRLNNLELRSGYYQQGISHLYAEDDAIRLDMNKMDEEHHEELHALANAIDSLIDSSTSGTIDLDDVIGMFEYLDGETRALHQTDASIRYDVSTNTARIASNTSRIGLIDSSIEDLSALVITNAQYFNGKINAIDSSIEDLSALVITNGQYFNGKINAIDSSISLMNHRINGIDSSVYNINTRLANVETNVSNLPPHVVLTADAYNNMAHHDASTFYFTYET